MDTIEQGAVPCVARPIGYQRVVAELDRHEVAGVWLLVRVGLDVANREATVSKPKSMMMCVRVCVCVCVCVV